MKMKGIVTTLGVVVLIHITACSNLAGSNAKQSTASFHPVVGVEFNWKKISRCLGSSPEFTLTEVPPDTHSLEFTLRDIYFPFFPHGGGNLEYTGENTISEGVVAAAKGHYIGPCALPFFPGQYKFTVEALDKDGLLLGKGVATRPFPHR